MSAYSSWSLPFFACLLSCLALLGSCAALLFVRSERRRAPEPTLPDPTVGTALAELAAEIGQMRVRLEELEQRKSPLSDYPAESYSINLNRRGQVLRLYRRGDSVAHIASALGLSTGEVALIVKVQEMVPPGRGKENIGADL